jgi:hypothetical protein
MSKKPEYNTTGLRSFPPDESGNGHVVIGHHDTIGTGSHSYCSCFGATKENSDRLLDAAFTLVKMMRKDPMQEVLEIADAHLSDDQRKVLAFSILESLIK